MDTRKKEIDFGNKNKQVGRADCSEGRQNKNLGNQADPRQEVLNKEFLGLPGL